MLNNEKFPTNDYRWLSCLFSGNYWFLSSVVALTVSKSLMVEVVPQDQKFNNGNAGIFHFRARI